MAINLRGLKNPNRNNSLITDLHFLGGIPKCGASSSASYTDMSWYSYIQRGKVSNENNFTTTDYLDTAFTYTAAISYEYSLLVQRVGNPKMNAYEYGYKAMGRNDDTMHAETYVADGSATSAYTSPLAYDPADINRVYDLYRTKLTQRDKFNVE